MWLSACGSCDPGGLSREDGPFAQHSEEQVDSAGRVNLSSAQRRADRLPVTNNAALSIDRVLGALRESLTAVRRHEQLLLANRISQPRPQTP